jgi:predicted transcriptional regulator
MITLKSPADRTVQLQARTAAELMTPNPLSLRASLTLREAIAFLVDRSLSGAPVIDEAGRPVGVLTQSDILIHDREEVDHVVPEVEHASPLPQKLWDAFQIERVDTTLVRDLMTPAVFCVALSTPSWSVIEQMRELHVHRLFVIDRNGVLVGVVTSMDIVRHLSPAE